MKAAILVLLFVVALCAVALLLFGEINREQTDHLRRQLITQQQQHAAEIQQLNEQNKRAGVYQFLQTRFEEIQEQM